jgi:hypothetical protein
MIKTMVIVGAENIRIKLVRLGFSFLYANNVSVLLLHPSKKAFAFCRAYAVGI